ncbi:hypothetical protein D5S18_18535 [Nocardia panacis]|uniref:Uncharacterized protein n=1 Tax=Nocardia panacis TaxID=2340916 RepID=A0A3A4KW25_9NOCA|nr:hypothetical protein [Nocardia panacis]RJO74151.1 hypothetical protein D5S18_18535 [Nocardia panacis]
MADILCAECERPVKDGLTLCVSCGDSLCEALLVVPELLLDIAITRARLDRVRGARTAGRAAEAALPVRAAGRGTLMVGDEALAAIGNTVTTWARALAEDLGVNPPINDAWLVRLTEQHRDAPPRDGTTLPLVSVGAVEQAAVWLAQHREPLRAYEAALELLRDITNAVDRLRCAVDRPRELRYLGPCSECGAELRAERGESWVRCRARTCRTQHEIASIEADARAAAEDRLYTLAELGGVLTAVGARIGRATLYRWAGARRIEPRGWQHEDEYGQRITDHQVSEGDRQVYRLGDVLLLATRDEKQGGSAA